jgi:hypothetical protein
MDWELTVLLLIPPQWCQNYPGHFGIPEVCLSLSQQGQVVPGQERLMVRQGKEALSHWMRGELHRSSLRWPVMFPLVRQEKEALSYWTRGERHRSPLRWPVMFPFHLRSVIELF